MEPFLTDLAIWLQDLGIWAWLAAPMVMAAVAVLPLPAEAPAMVNGILFGPVAGTVVTWTGAMAGAVISFELARLLGRPAAERILRPSALEKADRTVMAAGWWGLLVARFIPLIAFTALNWGAGLTPVPRWRFLWTTAVGITPAAVVFTASGSGAALLLRRLTPAAGAVGVAGVVIIAVWIHRKRRRATPSATGTGIA